MVLLKSYAEEHAFCEIVINVLWGRYDPKTEKKQMFFLVTESFLHLKSCVRPLLKACIEGFISVLHLRALSNLWGRYDPKTKKKQTFFLVTESFLHVESCVMSLQEGLTKGFISFCTPTSFEQYMRMLLPKKHNN